MTWKTQLEKALEQQAASRCERVRQSEAGPAEDSLLCGVGFSEVSRGPAETAARCRFCRNSANASRNTPGRKFCQGFLRYCLQPPRPPAHLHDVSKRRCLRDLRRPGCSRKRALRCHCTVPTPVVAALSELNLRFSHRGSTKSVRQRHGAGVPPLATPLPRKSCMSRTLTPFQLESLPLPLTPFSPPSSPLLSSSRDLLLLLTEVHGCGRERDSSALPAQRERERGEAQDAHLDYRTGGRMTIRPGQPLSCNSPPKPSFKGMDVVMMNDFEQRHRTSAKSRSHSPFGHIGSPTTPLNFEQLFQLNSELSHHDHTMLQAQLLNTMRHNNTPTTTMTPKPKLQHQQSQPSLAMLDQLRQAYNSQEQADWSNARQDEPSTIALLQQKFAQLERHKAEMQQQQQKPYPSQWTPVSSAAAAAPTYTESRFAPTSNSTFYSFHAPPVDSAPEQFSWRTTHDAPPSQMVYQQQQFQHPPQSKVVEYQHHPVPQFSAAPPQSSGSFTGFQLNAPPAAAAVPDMSLLGVSSRCDKTGGHSVEIKSVQHQDHHHYADSEMSLDNFSGRIMPQVQQPVAPTSSQMTFSSNFHMLPQSSKSAFTTFTRASSNLNPHHPVEAVVTKSLLFNDPYRHSSHEVPDSLHDDVDTELHL